MNQIRNKENDNKGNSKEIYDKESMEKLNEEKEKIE